MRKIYIAFEIEIPELRDEEELSFIEEIAFQLKNGSMSFYNLLHDENKTSLKSIFTGNWEYPGMGRSDISSGGGSY